MRWCPRSLDSCLCALLLHVRRLSAAVSAQAEAPRGELWLHPRAGDAAGGGGRGSGKAGAEFWGADPRPASRERIGASGTRRLKEESNARRSAEKERGRRDERLGDAPPPSFIPLPSPPGSPPPPPPPLHPFTKLFSSPAFLFLLVFPLSHNSPFSNSAISSI